MRTAELYLLMPAQPGLMAGMNSGLISLANFVEQRAVEARVHLLDWSELAPEQINAQWDQLRPASRPILGITTTTASYQSALAAARGFQKRFPEGLTVLGGLYATAQADLILQRSEVVDAVVEGEGEGALLALVSDHESFESVPNLAYRRGRAEARSHAGSHGADRAAAVARA